MTSEHTSFSLELFVMEARKKDGTQWQIQKFRKGGTCSHKGGGAPPEIAKIMWVSNLEFY
jgi:hypothetical protein